jgi:hypothetical protein
MGYKANSDATVVICKTVSVYVLSCTLRLGGPNPLSTRTTDRHGKTGETQSPKWPVICPAHEPARSHQARCRPLLQLLVLHHRYRRCLQSHVFGRSPPSRQRLLCPPSHLYPLCHHRLGAAAIVSQGTIETTIMTRRRSPRRCRRPAHLPHLCLRRRRLHARRQ